MREWALLLGGFGGVQVLVQAIGFTSGLLLVRALDKEQYALFTFANTMLGTMVVLADAGISSGVSSIAGRVWGDPIRLGQLVRTALRLRLVLVIVVAVVLCPALAVWLSSRGVGVVSSSVITLLVAVTLYFQVGVGVLGFVPKILLQTKRLQFIDLSCSAVRLVLVCMACATILNADTALLAAALAAVLSWRLLVWLTAGDFRKDVEPDPVMRQEILCIVKRQAPNAIYFAVQSQIMVWLISIFGTTANLAEVGALSRLALIFGVINSIVAGIVLPRFARCHDAVTLKRRYLQIVSGFVVLGGLLVLLAALFPAQVLMILGPKYMHLQPQVVLMALGSAVAAVSGVMWAFNFSKGWIPPAWLVIPFGIIVQVLLLYLIDVSSVAGVLLINIFSSLSAIFVSAGVFWSQIKKI